MRIEKKRFPPPFRTGTADAEQTAELASRKDLETVLRNTPFLLARYSSDLRCVFVNEAFARMLGCQPEELVGKKIAAVIGERAFQTILPHVNAVLAGQRVEFEAEVPYKNIGPRSVHVIYAPDKDQFDCVRGWIASITDITERKQIEAALRENEERLGWLASIVDSSDDAIVSKNLDGVVTSWNRGAERVFGYAAEEAVGQPITIVIPKDRQDEERMIQGADPTRGAYRPSRDGSATERWQFDRRFPDRFSRQKRQRRDRWSVEDREGHQRAEAKSGSNCYPGS